MFLDFLLYDLILFRRPFSSSRQDTLEMSTSSEDFPARIFYLWTLSMGVSILLFILSSPYIIFFSLISMTNVSRLVRLGLRYLLRDP
jgi:hypothetical protein